VFTDWTSEMAKRQHAIDGYLTTAILAAPKNMGSASGQTPQLAWRWFRDNPVGFNGVPFVLLKTMFRSRSRPPQSNSSRARAHLETPGHGARRRRDRPLDLRSHIGIAPNPSDYVEGVASAPAPAPSPLPFGFAFENARTFEPLSAADTAGPRHAVAGATNLQRTAAC